MDSAAINLRTKALACSMAESVLDSSELPMPDVEPVLPPTPSISPDSYLGTTARSRTAAAVDAIRNGLHAATLPEIVVRQGRSTIAIPAGQLLLRHFYVSFKVVQTTWGNWVRYELPTQVTIEFYSGASYSFLTDTHRTMWMPISSVA